MEPGGRLCGYERDGDLTLLSHKSGAKGSRTPDLLNAIQALYQLSYGPGPARGYTSLL